MKGNFKFLTIVALVLLASTLLLTGCMYAIAASNGGAKQYDLDAMSDSAEENVGVNTNDAPTSQTELQKKFAVYTLESKRQLDLNNGSMTQHGVQFFSEEQAEELKAKRDNGEIISLSYDEILYVISDSINQYFSNDYIILTNALKYGFTASHDSEMLSYNSYTIECYRGDYSEFVKADASVDFYGAEHQYERMLTHILDIITFRIAMLDTTFVKADFYKTYDMYDKEYKESTWLVVENCKPLRISGTGNESELSDFSPESTYWIKAFSGIETDNYSSYIEATAIEYANELLSLNGVLTQLYNAPYKSETEPTSLLKVSAEDIKITRDREAMFPTRELIEKKPYKADLISRDSTRQFFEMMTKEIYPEYDVSRPTEKLPMKYYQYGDDGNGGIKKGMSYKELVDAFGIPYDSSLSGFLGGCYITDEGDVILVYMGYEGENCYVAYVNW